MAEGTPIPLDKKVTVKEGLYAQFRKKIDEEGVELPRSDVKPRLGISLTLQIANDPVGIPVDAYQKSLGKYEGRKAHAEKREQAFSVRKQFSEFLEEISTDSPNH